MHPATRARWWRSRCGTASSASPARCRRGWPSPLRDRWRRQRACRSTFLRHDQTLPFVNPRGLAGTHHGRAIELFEDCRPCKGRSYVELLPLIDGTVEFRAVKARTPRASPRILEWSAAAFEFRWLDRRHEADTAHAIGDDLDRLLRRHVAEHAPMLLIEADAQLFELAHPQ